MDRRERIAVQRALAALMRVLRQWEALQSVSTDELRKALDGLARTQYLSPSQIGLLGTVGLSTEALASARAALLRQHSQARLRLKELHLDMERSVETLRAARLELGVGPESAPCLGRGAVDTVLGARGALRAAEDALNGETELRRSLLASLDDLDPQHEDERQRFLLVWVESPFASMDEGTLLCDLQTRTAKALESMASV